MNEREEVNRLECCERCGEPLALCGCWSTDNDLIGRLRQQLAEARAEVERQKQRVERREEMRRAVVDELGELRATLDACTGADTLERGAGEEHEPRLRQWLAAEQSKRQLLENQLAAQAAELERLRERCEAAEKLNALANEFTFYTADGGSVIFHRMLSETYFWCASWNTEGITRWSGDFETFDAVHAWTIAAGWLSDSNNKGGE